MQLLREENIVSLRPLPPATYVAAVNSSRSPEYKRKKKEKKEEEEKNTCMRGDTAQRER